MNFWRYLALGWRVDLRGWLWTWALCLILVYGLGVLALMEWVVWTVPERVDPVPPPPWSKVFFPAPSKARLVLSYVPKAQFSVHTRTMENKVLATFTNEADGIASEVVAYYKGGFSVAVKDLDANDYYPTAKVFSTLAEATAAAEKAVR